MCMISFGLHEYPKKKGVLSFHWCGLYYGSKLFAALPVRGLYNPAYCHVISTASLWQRYNILTHRT